MLHFLFKVEIFIIYLLIILLLCIFINYLYIYILLGGLVHHILYDHHMYHHISQLLNSLVFSQTIHLPAEIVYLSYE